MRQNFVLFVLCVIFAQINGAKILAIFPMGIYSHYSVGESTMKALHEAGHEVTMISAIEPNENFTHIKIKDEGENTDRKYECRISL